MTDLYFDEAERAEAAAWYSMSTRSAGGQTQAAWLGGGLVLTRPGVDSMFWNQAVGFDRTVDRQDLDEVLGRFRSLRITVAAIKTAPGALPGDWDEIRAAAGLTQDESQFKWAAPIEVAAKGTAGARSDLRVARVEAKDARRWSEVMWGIFGLNEELTIGATAAVLELPEWQGFAAWDGDEIVGTGMLFVHERIGQFFSGATRESHRGRGVQSAMIAARVAAAREAGVAWVTSETGVEPGGLNASSRNLSRAGFTPLYERPIWSWKEETETARA